MSTHGKQEITDPVEEMLKKTGCMELHFKVQECIAETQDWRKCQTQVTDFKKCMLQYQERKSKVDMLSSFFRKGQPLDFGPSKMVFLVRTDLQMGKGKIASQVAHATLSLYRSSVKDNNPCLNTWLLRGQPKIVLKVDSESAMNEAYKQAVSNNLTVCKVFDGGKTQIKSGSLTVVGLGPNKVDSIDEITKQFKLL